MKTLFPPRAQSGSVLIIVLWVAFGLVSLAIYFANSSSLELRAADNRVASLEAQQAIAGAARYLSNALANVTEPGLPPDPATLKMEAVPVGEAHFWLIGRALDEEDTEDVTWGLVDESSKLNLNTATAAMLQNLPLMTPDLAASIVSWRNTNSSAATSGNGAGDSIYNALNPPYRCKNAPFENTDELRLVYGFTNGVLYGEDVNLNGVLDPNENDGDIAPPTDNQDGRLDRGVLAYVTVHSKVSNLRTNGEPKVNVGTVSTNDLRKLMTDAGISTASVQKAMQAFSTSTLPPPPGSTNPPASTAGNNTNNSVLQFYIKSGLTAAEFQLIENDISVSTNKVVVGLVNVNTASATVLGCLPGLDSDNKAVTLVATRTGQDTQHSIAWLKDALTPADAVKLGPYITGRSDVYSADIAALGHYGRGYQRVRFIFDSTDGWPAAPKIRQRQDLTHLGWALGQNVRRQLAEAQNTP